MIFHRRFKNNAINCTLLGGGMMVFFVHIIKTYPELKIGVTFDFIDVPCRFSTNQPNGIFLLCFFLQVPNNNAGSGLKRDPEDQVEDRQEEDLHNAKKLKMEPVSSSEKC